MTGTVARLRIALSDTDPEIWRRVEVPVEAVEPPERDVKYPRYIDGANRCPPEDVGGTPGFENFFEAIGDPEHPDHRELTEWYDECHGGRYVPDTIDELATKRRVAAIAIRRAAGKAAYARRRDP